MRYSIVQMRPKGEITALLWTVGKADGDVIKLTGGGRLPSGALNAIDKDGVRVYYKDVLVIPESHPYYNAGLLSAEPTLNHRKIAKMLHKLYNEILKTVNN